MNKTYFQMAFASLFIGMLLASCEDPKKGHLIGPEEDQDRQPSKNTMVIDELPKNAQVAITSLTSSPLPGGDQVMPSIPLVAASPDYLADDNGWIHCGAPLSAPHEDGVYLRILGVDAHVTFPDQSQSILSIEAPDDKAYLYNLFALSSRFLQELGQLNLKPGQVIDWVKLKVCKEDIYWIDEHLARELNVSESNSSPLKFSLPPLVIKENKEYQLKLAFDVSSSMDRGALIFSPSIQATWLESP